MAGLFSRAFERRSDDVRDADDLRSQAADAGCGLIEACPDRAMVTVHGELRSVTVRSTDEVTALEAEVFDGSGAVTLIWLGRRRIAGVQAGRRLTARGRLGHRGSERIIYNPRYELEA